MCHIEGGVLLRVSWGNDGHQVVAVSWVDLNGRERCRIDWDIARGDMGRVGLTRGSHTCRPKFSTSSSIALRCTGLGHSLQRDKH